MWIYIYIQVLLLCFSRPCLRLWFLPNKGGHPGPSSWSSTHLCWCSNEDPAFTAPGFFVCLSPGNWPSLWHLLNMCVSLENSFDLVLVALRDDLDWSGFCPSHAGTTCPVGGLNLPVQLGPHPHNGFTAGSTKVTHAAVVVDDDAVVDAEVDFVVVSCCWVCCIPWDAGRPL